MLDSVFGRKEEEEDSESSSDESQNHTDLENIQEGSTSFTESYINNNNNFSNFPCSKKLLSDPNVSFTF